MAFDQDVHSTKPRIVVISCVGSLEATDHIVRGARDELTERDIVSELVTVPDLFAIPTTVKYFIHSMEVFIPPVRMDGYIFCACTDASGNHSQTDDVSRTQRSLDQLTIQYALATGRGFFQYDKERWVSGEAHAAAFNDAYQLGVQAAKRCLSMIDIKTTLRLFPR
jgi:6,7-dimethyl-8-ribityllumazine synthase